MGSILTLYTFYVLNSTAGKIFAGRVVNRAEARCMLLLPPSGSGSADKAGPLLFSYPKVSLLNL
jgi:hypothetical protein